MWFDNLEPVLKKRGHPIIPGTSFRRGPESSVVYQSTRGPFQGSGSRRSYEFTATGPIDTFDTGSQTGTTLENVTLAISTDPSLRSPVERALSRRDVLKAWQLASNNLRDPYR